VAAGRKNIRKSAKRKRRTNQRKDGRIAAAKNPKKKKRSNNRRQEASVRGGTLIRLLSNGSEKERTGRTTKWKMLGAPSQKQVHKGPRRNCRFDRLNMRGDAKAEAREGRKNFGTEGSNSERKGGRKGRGAMTKPSKKRKKGAASATGKTF